MVEAECFVQVLISACIWCVLFIRKIPTEVLELHTEKNNKDEVSWFVFGQQSIANPSEINDIILLKYSREMLQLHCIIYTNIAPAQSDQVFFSFLMTEIVNSIKNLNPKP